jgi:hypothetical protein
MQPSDTFTVTADRWFKGFRQHFISVIGKELSEICVILTISFGDQGSFQESILLFCPKWGDVRLIPQKITSQFIDRLQLAIPLMSQEEAPAGTRIASTVCPVATPVRSSIRGGSIPFHERDIVRVYPALLGCIRFIRRAGMRHNDQPGVRELLHCPARIR